MFACWVVEGAVIINGHTFYVLRVCVLCACVCVLAPPPPPSHLCLRVMVPHASSWTNDATARMLKVGPFDKRIQPCCKPGCTPFPSCCKCGAAPNTCGRGGDVGRVYESSAGGSAGGDALLNRAAYARYRAADVVVVEQ